jgi:hypothetical protein
MPARKNCDLLRKMCGQVMCYQNKYIIKSGNSTDSIQARYVKLRQNVDWIGETYNGRGF